MLEDVLKAYGATEVSALQAYTSIFRLGEGYIQKYNQESRNLVANPLGCMLKNGTRHGRFRVLFEDTFEETLQELQEADFAIVNGISYFGRRNLQEHASKMFCMIFDIDGVTDNTLQNLLSGADFGIYPKPNYIVLSGHGIHLYFIFEEPVSLFPYTKIQLKELKYRLTDLMWNRYTSTLENKQFQGINQGFRVIGGKTKIDGVRTRAFSIYSHPYGLQQLCEFVPEEYRVDEKALFKESKMSLEEAKRKFPEWYQKRIVEGQVLDGHWTCKRDLYDWWIRQIRQGATYGHRYFCIMCLAIFGVKCGLDLKEIRKDANALVPFLNALNPNEPFTKSDVRAALECYDERYFRFPRADISRISGIPIRENKRNGRKQAVHLRIARNVLEILNDEEGRCLQGRKSKADVVQRWRKEHPEGKKADCIKETGLSRSTVYRHWNK